MSRPTQTLPDATGRVRDHFRKKAFSFDHLYDEEHAVQRALRPGLFRRREFALSVVREHREPRVLDVGWGSTRGCELALAAAPARYAGVGFSQPMRDTASARLASLADR